MVFGRAGGTLIRIKPPRFAAFRMTAFQPEKPR